MAGFKPDRKTYTLDFTGTPLDGLIVKARSVSLGAMLDLQSASDKALDREDPDGSSSSTRKMVGIFASALREWNLLDDDDVPVPATLEGALSQDIDVITTIIQAWSTAISGVSAPLDAGSASGATSQELSLPMAPLSPSPTS